MWMCSEYILFIDYMFCSKIKNLSITDLLLLQHSSVKANIFTHLTLLQSQPT